MTSLLLWSLSVLSLALGGALLWILKRGLKTMEEAREWQRRCQEVRAERDAARLRADYWEHKCRRLAARGEGQLLEHWTTLN